MTYLGQDIYQPTTKFYRPATELYRHRMEIYPPTTEFCLICSTRYLTVAYLMTYASGGVTIRLAITIRRTLLCSTLCKTRQNHVNIYQE